MQDRDFNILLSSLKGIQLGMNIPENPNFTDEKLNELYAYIDRFSKSSLKAREHIKKLSEYTDDFDSSGTVLDFLSYFIEKVQTRDEALLEMNASLSKSTDLLTTIMNTIKESLIVINAQTNEIIFSNKKQDCLIFEEKTECAHTYNCAILNILYEYDLPYNSENIHQVICENESKILKVKTFAITWNNISAYAHIIYDITESKEKEDLLESLAYKDESTGLFNRRYCMRLIDDLLDTKIHFSLAFIDLDKLKDVNDSFGHLVGDEYISTVANIVSSHMRTTDYFCRIGGDEFVLILPECSYNVAERKLMDIYQSIKSRQSKYYMSISYGVISSDFSLRSQEILSQADKLMYEFKQKNRKSL